MVKRRVFVAAWASILFTYFRRFISIAALIHARIIMGSASWKGVDDFESVSLVGLST